MTPVLALLLLLLPAALSLAASLPYICRAVVLRWRGRISAAAPTAKVADGPEAGLASVAAVERFSWADIRVFTAGLSSQVVGRGGFSTVYLARLPGSATGAVKVHHDGERPRVAFRRELEVLLRARHDNIVRLLGYSDDQEGGALVLEYVAGGSLHERLHTSQPALTWPERTSVAAQLAAALHYLHEGCRPQITHNDVKACNILLLHHHGRLCCKLCDFGSATVGFSASVTPAHRHARTVVGSPGYVDPHYVRTGIASGKSDIYSFGVVLMELLTGRLPLCAETRRALAAEEVGGWVDARLGGEYESGEAAAMAELARVCVAELPSSRPTMAEVVRVVKEKAGSAVEPDRNKFG